jgi:hypothetical protein
LHGIARRSQPLTRNPSLIIIGMSSERPDKMDDVKRLFLLGGCMMDKKTRLLAYIQLGFYFIIVIIAHRYKQLISSTGSKFVNIYSIVTLLLVFILLPFLLRRIKDSSKILYFILSLLLFVFLIFTAIMVNGAVLADIFIILIYLIYFSKIVHNKGVKEFFSAKQARDNSEGEK